MKKNVVILIALLILVGCKQKEIIKREDYYNVSCGSLYFVPGFDEKTYEQSGDITNIEYRTSLIRNMFNKVEGEKEVLSYVEFYTHGDLIKIDGLVENKIDKACSDFNGELINKNGVACYIGKRVEGRENYIILHGDILADDINIIDRVEVGYDVKE